ncbi:S-adenosylhomocysteine deaminase; Methylthioadenosine deaminase [hydrothermal vent metagenome]|uniref:S-adenosylhomocysteine deaminase Methylthioadenosine deaminase n=1 Tax=hydrothermal vent metagenome TaxID=652676 RepID=A0A3B0Y7J3_9ZZZZ
MDNNTDDNNDSLIDELIHARWVIPVEPHNMVLDNFSIAIHDGIIIDILPQDKARQRYPARNVYELPDHALIPGLINSHTHAAMNLMRGYADDHSLMDWLQKHIWPAEQKWVNNEFVRDGSQLAIAEMLRSGTTCFNDMYFYPEITAHVAQESGIRATVGLIVLDYPSRWANNADEYIKKGLQLHNELRDSALVSTAFAPHAPYTVSDEPLKKIRTLSEQLDIPVHIHVHETLSEINESMSQYGLRPLQRLHKFGLISPRMLAVHMTQVNKHDIQLLSENNAHIIHCPESNMKLASGICPVPSLLHAGINVALGTDSVASNNDLNMLGEMQTAGLIAKASTEDAEALPAADILRMATLNGAKALGLEDIIGSLAVDKAADIVAIKLNTLETLPVYNPIATLIYSASRHNVSHVWVNGKILLNNKELCTMDIDALIQKAHSWQEKLQH